MIEEVGGRFVRAGFLAGYFLSVAGRGRGREEK